MNNDRLMILRRPAAEFINSLVMAAVLLLWVLTVGPAEASSGPTVASQGKQACAGGGDVFMLIAILAVLNAGVLASLYLHLKRAKQTEAERLASLAEVVRRLGEGDFSLSADEKDDRFMEIAKAVNNMSTNIQEVLIFLWKQNTEAMNFINHLTTVVSLEGPADKDEYIEVLRQCQDIRNHHEDIRNLLGDFRFFGVDMNVDGVWHTETQETV